jgi:amino-acid N-acetyltransferase
MNVSDLRGILTYVPRFREKIFVIAVDGEIAASPNFGNILLDLAVLRSLSVKVILVHGAAFQIEKLATARGVKPTNSDGTGITDEATLQVSLDAATTLMNEIMQGLTSVDLRAAYANAVIAHPAGILGGVDFLHTGKVERVDTKLLQLLLNEGVIPVVPPIGFDGEGRTFRVNSDAIAVEIAEALQAMKIIYLGARDAVVANGELVRQLSIAEAEDLVKKRRGQVDVISLSKLEHGARACRNGIARVHLLNGNVDEALLAEVFSPEGVGTMIYSNDYQQIRRVFKKDVRALLILIRSSIEHAELVKRFASVSEEVELGYSPEQTATEVQRCLNCDIETHFTASLCIECDACVDVCPVNCLTIAPVAETEAELRTRLSAPADNPTQDLYVSAALPQTHRIMVKDEDICLHCGLCAERCPTAAWDMQKFSLVLPYAFSASGTVVPVSV